MSYSAAIARHLPPSAATLRLLDLNGQMGASLKAYRADVAPVAVSGDAETWDIPPASMDAVVAFEYVLNPAFLESALAILRPGGRLIVANSRGRVDRTPGQMLEQAGYVRILVEPALEDGTGLLIRGERRHTTDDTLARIQGVAGADAEMIDLATYRGRYVHLLIQQTPNKPVWARADDEPVQWRAVTLQPEDGQPVLLAFSSLPRAVGFMQPAVLAGQIKDVNKVGKFSKQTAATWTLPVLLNPAVAVLEDAGTGLVLVDPATAEAPDE
jgi:SAM-dependent methyltransferase